MLAICQGATRSGPKAAKKKEALLRVDTKISIQNEGTTTHIRERKEEICHDRRIQAANEAETDPKEGIPFCFQKKKKGKDATLRGQERPLAEFITPFLRENPSQNLEGGRRGEGTGNRKCINASRRPKLGVRKAHSSHMRKIKREGRISQTPHKRKGRKRSHPNKGKRKYVGMGHQVSLIQKMEKEVVITGSRRGNTRSPNVGRRGKKGTDTLPFSKNFKNKYM